MSQSPLFGAQTEASFQSGVIALARLRGWRVHHVRPARTAHGWRTPVQGDVGFPDLVLVRSGRLVFAELKAERGQVRPEQQAWLEALRAAGVECHVWKPVDWSDIEEALK